MMPRLSSVLIQTASRSIEIGSAEATPTAIPRSLARVSSLTKVRSISAEVGTESRARDREDLADGVGLHGLAVGTRGLARRREEQERDAGHPVHR